MTAHDQATERTINEDTVDSDFPELVRHTLADYFELRVAECRDLDPAVADAASELVNFVLGGGKRLRPTFAWWGWRAAGGEHSAEETTAMLRAASSLELIQACALIHDDLIDDSATRRGNPTVHVRFAEHHQRERWHGRSREFGAATAILLGDLALAWADDLFHSAGLSDTARSRALPPWQAMRTEVLAGQYLDILSQARGDERPHTALRIDELKSASYTVSRPLELGAEIAGLAPDSTAQLREFGSDIGVAFQLRDDVLGVFGDPAVTGKPAGDDLREGKRTLLVAETFDLARQQDDDAALELLRTTLGNGEAAPEQIDDVRDAMLRLGAVRSIEDRISTLTRNALGALDDANLHEPAANRLAELAIAVTDRAH